MEQDTHKYRRIPRKHIQWITEVPTRCTHPNENIVWNDNTALFEGFGHCDRCGIDMSRDEVRCIGQKEEKDRRNGLQQINDVETEIDEYYLSILQAAYCKQYHHPRMALK